MTNPYRQLPPISDLLERPELAGVRAAHSHDDVTAALRSELDELRKRIASGKGVEVESIVANFKASLRCGIDAP